MRAVGLAIAATLLGSAPVCAHDLGVTCHLAGDRLEVRAFFDDGTRAAQAKVHLFRGENELLHEGETDERGRWSCPKPGPGDYHVVVDAGMGHRRQVRVTIPVKEGGAGQVSQGPTEEEFTAFPWLKLIIGVGALLGFGLIAWLLNRRKLPRQEKPLG